MIAKPAWPWIIAGTAILLFALAVAMSAMAEETLYQSWLGGQTAMLRGSEVIMLMPNDAEMHHIDTSEGYPHLYPGSCIAAPPAKCLLRPGDVEPMREVPK